MKNYAREMQRDMHVNRINAHRKNVIFALWIYSDELARFTASMKN